MKPRQLDDVSYPFVNEVDNNEETNQFHKTNHPERPSLYILHGSELILSRTAIIELMSAVLEKGKDFRFRARGWSMSPFIKDGDVICISPFGVDTPKTGEIVAFDRPERSGLVVHRLIGRHGNKWMIQGDNTPEENVEFIPKDKILGRVTCVERDGRPVWSGNGPERYLIAWLSRAKLLGPLLIGTRSIRNRFSKIIGNFRGKR